jgi:DNA-directed RNA polymerase subunit RPC12/RpoP
MTIVEYNLKESNKLKWYHHFVKPKCPECGKIMTPFLDWTTYAGWQSTDEYRCYDCRLKRTFR